MKLRALALSVKDAFGAQGLENPALDARLLIAHALGLSQEEYLLRQDDEISGDDQRKIDALVAQRLQSKPVAKIIGRKEFYGRGFLTNEHTLDPRPDTETLIDAVLKKVSRDASLRILDLGTGTGCLLLTLLSELQQAHGVAVDVSEQALTVARENAARLHVAARAEFLHSDWFNKVSGTFDVIVSNPPYIPSAEIAHLADDVKRYDPMGALDGGADGLDPYRLIATRAPDFLVPGGLLAVEGGIGQAADISVLLENQGFQGIEVLNDLACIGRVVLANRR